MKIVIAGGTGQLGQLLTEAFRGRGDEVVILSRVGSHDPSLVEWDGSTLGPWAQEIDDADVVINLAGTSVNARPTEAHFQAMMSSRVDSTRVIGEAIAHSARPPRVWVQASAANIYAHRFDAPNDELTGQLGGDEPGVPSYWRHGVDVVQAWERAQEEAPTPGTRKVALRTSMVMGAGGGGVFDVLLGLTRVGLGGSIAGGHQFVSWIHEQDFARAVEFLIDREDLDGPFNLTSPLPLPQRDFMAILRKAWGTRVGLPASKWMVQIGALFLRTDPELVLKSRRVVPRRLEESGFTFEFPAWPEGARDLVDRWRGSRG